MGADWQITTLQEVCLKITDGAHNSPKSVTIGKPMASVKDLTRFGVDLREARHISTEDFEILVRQGCQPIVGDVLIAKDGNSALDTVCNVKKPLDAVLLSSVAILRPDPEKINSDFLKYYFTSQETISYLKSNFISGAAIPRVVLKDFKKAQIKLPPLQSQKKISSVLSSLDDKIELNRQINQTLEEMAQAIFKSLFVDFEPVKAKIEAKANGQDPERAAMCAINGKTDEELDLLSPDQLAQLRATAALFPDELTDSELGLIPKGWEVKYLRDVSEIAYGKNLPTKKLLPEGFPVFGGNGVIGYYSEYLYHEPRVLIACRGAASGKVLRSLPKSYVTNNSLVIDHEKKSYLTSYYLQPSLELFNLVDLTSGSAQPQMTITNMNPVQVVVPTQEIIANHTSLVEPLYKQILSLNNQSALLEKIRDTLLSKLLSGEIELTANPISS